MRTRTTFVHSLVDYDAVVVRACVREGLSQLFRVDVDVLCESPSLELGDALFSAGTLLVQEHEVDAPRAFHGMVTRAAYVGEREQKHLYQFCMEPQIRALAYRSRSRIFQESTTVEIVQRVLSDAGLPSDDFDWRVGGTYPTREYTVQYRETELDFVQRLLEHEGIHFFFEHDEAGHRMVFSDAIDYGPIDGESCLPYSAWGNTTGDSVSDVRLTSSVTSEAMCYRDWNSSMPETPLVGEAASESSRLRVTRYPGGFADNAQGTQRAQRSLQAAMRHRHRLTARSTCHRLMPGKTFLLLDVLPDSTCGEYLLVDLQHTFDLQDREGPKSGYACRIVAQRAEAAFRPEAVTPRPRANGIETAVVTGPAGSEIHTDPLGRIKVHFYWDREGAIDDTATCWIRTQQNNTSGGLMIPRVGWEVSVAFENGDPDRPIALQKLYNNETMPPYELPANLTQSSLQSSTSPGGGAVNEIRMQDASGGQQFGIYASRDAIVTAGHNMSEEVAVDSAESVGVNATTRVGADRSVDIGGTQTLSVTGPLARQTVGSSTVDVGAMDDWGVTDQYSLTCGGSRTDTVAALMNVLANHAAETVNGDLSRTVGAAMATTTGTALVEVVGGSKTETVGGAKIELVAKSKAETIASTKTLTTGALRLKSGKGVAMNAGAALNIMVAGALEETVADGYALSGKQLRITVASAKLDGGGGKLDLAGSKITLNGSSFAASGLAGVTFKGKVDFKR
ncbi:MAG: type VI secretion system tip protein TssI/VgrG [Polyangiales bacterium]